MYVYNFIKRWEEGRKKQDKNHSDNDDRSRFNYTKAIDIQDFEIVPLIFRTPKVSTAENMKESHKLHLLS